MTGVGEQKQLVILVIVTGHQTNGVLQLFALVLADQVKVHAVTQEKDRGYVLAEQDGAHFVGCLHQVQMLLLVSVKNITEYNHGFAAHLVLSLGIFVIKCIDAARQRQRMLVELGEHVSLLTKCQRVADVCGDILEEGQNKSNGQYRRTNIKQEAPAGI